HAYGAGARVQRHDRSGPPREELERQTLRRRVERGVEIVPHLLLPRQLVDDRGELVGVAGQVVVVLLLEPRAAVRYEGVAHRVGEQVVRRIAAPVAERRPLAGLRVHGELGAVVRVDEAARDLQLLEQRPAIRGLVLEALRLEHGPARGEHHEQGEQHEHDAEELRDLAVQTTPPRSAGPVLAAFDTISSSASTTKLARIELPPYETKGSVTPVRGITRVTPPTITNTCSANTDARPAASSLEKPSWAISAVLNPRAANSR